MQVTKRLGFASVRFSDPESESIRAWCSDRGVSRSELIRRAVLAFIAQPTDDKPGAKPKPRSAKVSRVDEHGADALYSENGALKR